MKHTKLNFRDFTSDTNLTCLPTCTQQGQKSRPDKIQVHQFFCKLQNFYWVFPFSQTRLLESKIVKRHQHMLDSFLLILQRSPVVTGHKHQSQLLINTMLFLVYMRYLVSMFQSVFFVNHILLLHAVWSVYIKWDSQVT